MTKHTAGKWEVDLRNKTFIHVMFNKTDADWSWCALFGQNQEANARLIAASSTMYEYIAKKSNEGDNEASKIIKEIGEK